MRHGGWRNESCAKGFEDSLAYKTRTGEMIQSSIIGPATPTTVSVETGGVLISLDSFYDSSIDDVALIDVVERANQSVSSDSCFDSSIDDSELLDVVERASQSVGNDIVMHGQRNDVNCATSTSLVLTQNSTLNARLSRSFKSVNFGKMENCTFNFYLGNGPTV